MAEQQPNTPDTDLPEQPATGGGRSSLLAKLQILAFVVVVVGVECFAAYLYLPTAADTAASAESVIEANYSVEEPPEFAEQLSPEPIDQVEIDLGEFSVTSFQPVSNTTLRIDFHLYGTVAAENEEAFIAAMQDNLHRFREQVIVTVRSAEITDLTDAGLGLMKRKILERSNRALGEPFLRSVIFSDFSFIEQ
jgi:flagellar FliL protein